MALRQHHLGILLLAPLLLGAAPSRSFTYTAGQVINPSDVTTNEDNIFSYLQAGVDTLRTGSVTSSAILDGTIANADIASSAAIAYSKLSLTGSIVAGDLSSTLTVADGVLINLSAINISSTSEGLILPQNTSCASGTAEGQICWDTDDDALFVGTGAAALQISSSFKVGSFTRDLTTASGTQAVTGVGFTPKACFFLGGVNNSSEVSWGMQDATSDEAVADTNANSTDTYNTSNSTAIFLVEGGGKTTTATVSSFDSDGFTISWTRNSTPSGTATMNYACFR